MPLIATTVYKATVPPMLPPMGMSPPPSSDPVKVIETTVEALRERLQHAIATAADCIRQLNECPGLEMHVDHTDGWVFIGARTPPKPVEWSGPDFYQIEQGDKRPIYWIERVDYKTKPGHYYRAVSRWKGRNECKPFCIKPDDLRIVSKRADYAGRLPSDLQA